MTTSIVPRTVAMVSTLPPQGNQTPTIRALPPRYERNQLQPQYKTVTLPAKVVTSRLLPIGSLSTPPTNQLQLSLTPVPPSVSVAVPGTVPFTTQSITVP